MQIDITNLRLRAIIGIEDWEREKKQDILLNISLQFDGSVSGKTDNIEDTVNYKKLTKSIIALVESSSFYLIEKLGTEILALCVADDRVEAATVKVEKPGALRYADSVGITVSATK